jgi:hypothetical protein
VLQELRIDVDVTDIRTAVRERLHEYDDGGREARTKAERCDNAWRVVQNLLAEELAQLNEGLADDAQILEKDRLAMPDGSQAIDIIYRDQKFSIVRPKDRRSLALVDSTAGLLPIENLGSKLFVAGEPIASGLLRAINRLVERATAGVNSHTHGAQHYMAIELPSTSASKVEAALNLAHENGYRFLESYRGQQKNRRLFVFERVMVSDIVPGP